jgi:hypothetical protein
MMKKLAAIAVLTAFSFAPTALASTPDLFAAETQGFDGLSLERIADCEYSLETLVEVIRSPQVTVPGQNDNYIAIKIDDHRAHWRRILVWQVEKRGRNANRIDSQYERRNYFGRKAFGASDNLLEAVKAEVRECLAIEDVAYAFLEAAE